MAHANPGAAATIRNDYWQHPAGADRLADQAVPSAFAGG